MTNIRQLFKLLFHFIYFLLFIYLVHFIYLFCLIYFLLLLIVAYPWRHLVSSRSASAARPEAESLVEMDNSLASREAFLRTFCRHCNTQPVFCGDLITLCYA